MGITNKIIPLIVLGLAVGCATHSNFDAKMNFFVGKSLQDYEAATGIKPDDVLPDKNGGHIYVFRNQANDAECTMTFRADSGDTILSATHTGKACKSRDGAPK